MAYKTLDEAFKDTFTPTSTRTVSMDEAFKATFGEAFENTFGEKPVETETVAKTPLPDVAETPNTRTVRHRGKEYTVPDRGENYGGRAVRGAVGGLLNSAGAGTLRALADLATKAGHVVPTVKYDPEMKKVILADEMTPQAEALRDATMLGADKINEFTSEMIAAGLGGRDPEMLDKVAQGFGSSAGFMIPAIGMASRASKAMQAGNLAKAALYGGIHSSMESLTEGGEAFAAQKKQGASDKEATAASTITALSQLPINFISDTAGSLVAGPGGGMLRSMAGRALSEGIQEPLQGVVSNVTSQRKEDGTPMTWGDLFRAVPEMAKAFPDAVLEEGVPAAISAAIFGAGEGVHNRVATRASAKQDIQTQAKPAMTLDEAFEAMQAETPIRASRVESDVVTPSGMKVKTRFKLADAGDLITSNTDAFGINEAYPQELQPRQRDRTASRQQIENIVSNLNPELLGESKLASDGAPIVGADNVVESGNGRVLAVRQIYGRGEATAEQAAKYRQFIVDNAERFGISPEEAMGMERPVLVRERVSDVDRRQFAEDANVSNMAAMSGSEIAMRDARNMNLDMLAGLNPDVDLLSNRDFIRNFAQNIVPRNELGTFMDGRGMISQDGVKRIQNALFAKAYGDEQALSRMGEAVDDNTRNINRALLQASPVVAAMQERVGSGILRGDLSLAEHVVQAANTLTQLRNDKIKVSEFLQQKNLFDGGISPEARHMLAFFEKNKQRPNVITNFLTDVARSIETHGAANQVSLFEKGDVTLDSIIRETAKRYLRTPGGGRQAEIFGEPVQALAERREPLKIDEATIRAHQFAARPMSEEASNISFRDKSFDEIRSMARVRVEELSRQTFHGIEGEEIYFAPGQGEDWDSYTDHLISGLGGTEPNAGRAKALWMVADTIARPVAVFDQQNGNRAYISLYEGDKQRAHHIVVQVAPDGRARTVTSIISKDSGINSAKASNYVKSQIKRASDVLYVEGVTEERGLRTRHWRGPADHPASSESALLHRLGKKNIAPADENVNVEGTEDSQFLPAGRGELRAFEPPIMERPEADSRSDNPVKVGEIKDAIDKIVPWRFQKVARGTLGQFKVAPEVTRTKYRNDVTAELHELGHYLDKRLGLNETQSPPALQELADAGAATSRETYTPEQVRDEGIAQFFLNYAVDREAAREQFPAYFEEFEAKLGSDPELKADVDRVVGLASSYLGQNAGERMKASIVRFDERQKAPVKERAKKAFDRFYENFVDSLDPLQKVSDSLREQLGVEHLPDDVNIIAQARTMPGYKGKMAKDVSAFFDVIRELGPQDHDALNAYLASARAQDYRVLGMEPGLGRTAAQDARTIREAPQHIREAAEKLYGVYSDVLAKTLVETGMITRETQEYWKKRWPHYVPFIRIDSSRNMDADVTALLKGGGRNIVNIANPIKTTTGVADAAEVMNIADPLSAMLRNIDIFHSIAARNEVGKTLINVSGIEGMGRFAEKVSGPGEKGDNVFYVWNGGKKEYYATDPDVYRALASLGDSPGAKSFILHSLQNVAEWFKMGTTRYNPAFALFRNLPRDSVESTLNSKNKWAIPVANTVQGVVRQFSKNPKTQAAVQKAIDEGILYSSIVEIRDNSWEGLAGSLSKAFKEGGAGVKSKRAAMDVLEIFGKLNEAVEIAPKVQEYFYLTSHGVPEKEAVMRSRQVNIDFARSGRIGKVINRYIPFFNASIQGTDKTLRNVKENPKMALAKAAVWIGGPSLLTWALGTLGGDDDDRKDYAEIPLEQKDRFWFAKMGGQWIKIPKPQLYGAVGSLVERVLEKAYRDNPVAFDGFLSGIADEVKPPVLPAIFLSSIEATTNYNFYTGRSLVPRSLSNLPPEMQYTDRTSEISKAASRLVYNATGDSVSPIKIDHMLRSIGGTMGTAAINTTNRLFGKDEPIHSAVTGVFTRSLFTDPNKSSASINRFYDVLERTEDEATRYKARRTAGERGEPNRDVRFAPVFARQAKSLSDLRKRRAAIQEHPSLSPASKRKYLDEMDERMVDLARGVLERYDKYWK